MKNLAVSIGFSLAVCSLPATGTFVPGEVTSIILTTNTDASRLMQSSSQYTSLNEVVIAEVNDDAVAMNLVASVASCNNVRNITFRNCSLQQLPGNLRMLTQIMTIKSENTEVADGEQFYNAIADMPNVRNVSVSGNNFRNLPSSFFRLRTMDNIDLVNEDIGLARGYDRNTKTPDQLRVTDSVQFGFGADALNLRYTCYNAEASRAHLSMFRDVLQGAFRASNEFYSPVNLNAFNKQHPLVHPSVSGIEIQPDVYTVNNLTGTVLEYGSGTKIIVPPMAFVDACGNAVSGPVDITYREFRDQLDVVLSGIPMDYDSGGVAGKFESAGMFDIEAAQNGEEVFLADGKELDMKFAVTDTASDFNFYRLDENNGWQYLENTGTVERDSTDYVPASTRVPDASSNIPTITFAVTQYCNAAKHIRVRNWIRDTTAFDDRYNDTCYFGTEQVVSDSSSWPQKIKASYSSRLYMQRRAGGPDYTVVSLRNMPGRAGWNTELSAYNSCLWKLDGKLSDKEMNERYGEDAGINDCRILQEGADYFIELKYFWGFAKIKAEPVRLNKDGEVVALEEDKKEKLFDSYTLKLNARRTRMTNWNQQQIGRQRMRIERAHNDSVRAWTGLKKVMSADEKEMNFSEWQAYTNERAPYVKDHNWTAPIVNTSVFKIREEAFLTKAIYYYQQLPLPKLGIFNCDRVVKPRPNVPLKVFVSKAIAVAGAVIVPTIIHVVDKVRNRVLSYSGGTIGAGVRASYEANASVYLLASDKEGNLYQVTESNFTLAEQANASNPEFSATLVSGPGSTAATVREIIDRGNQ